MSDPPAQLFEKAVSGGGNARRLGQWGEAVVAEDLRQKGWTIITTNFRCRMGEIDIIAQNGQYLAFVEVKLRKNGRFGAACEAVTPSKQRKLRLTAQIYLSGHPTDLQPRFDVAEVFPADAGGRRQINYITSAFE